MKIAKIFEYFYDLVVPVASELELWEIFEAPIAHQSFEDEDFDVEGITH